MSKHTPILKAASVLVALIFMVSVLTVLPLSAAIPSLSVSITTSAFPEGDVTLPVSLKNFGSTPVTVSRVDVVSTNSFTGSSLTGLNLQVPANDTATFNLPVRYSGNGNTLKLTIYTNDGADSMTTTLAVDAAVPTPTSTTDPGGITPEVYVYAVTTRTANAGEAAPFVFRLANKNNNLATNVRVKVEGEGESAALFTFDTPTGWVSTSAVDSVGITIQPNLYIYPTAKEGSYKLKFLISYTNSAGIAFEREDSCTLYVKASGGRTPLLTGVTLDRETIGSDNKAKATVKIANPTSKSISDVSVALNPEGSAGFSLYENFAPVTLSSVAAGGTAEAAFSLYVDPTLTAGNYPISFILSWRDETGRLNTTAGNLYVEIKRSAKSGGTGSEPTLSKPRIIISKYSTDTSMIKAGQAFTLSFTLTNTSSETAVNNLKVVLGSAVSGTSGKAVFFPAEGSNSFFIEKIAAKGSVTKTIKLMAGQDTDPGIYALIINLEYEDSQKTTYTSEENISFSVNQEQRLEVSGLAYPADTSMGPIPFSFNYVNKGKTVIYNLSVEAEGDFTLEGGSNYIGNLAAGYNDYFSGVLIPSAEGQQKGFLVLKFENSQGQSQEVRLDISANVMAAEIPVDGGIDGGAEIPMEESGGGITLWIIVGLAGVLVIGGITAFILIKRKKTAKGRVIDEED